MLPVRVLLTVASCALALGGCGGNDDATTSATVTAPAGVTSGPPGAPDAPTGPSGATAPATEPAPGGASGTTASAAPPQAPSSAEATGPGRPGAGDEEPIRQPVRFEVGGTDVTPATVSVAPFLAIELALVNVGDVALQVRLIGTDTTVSLPAGERRTRRLAGLRAGVYTLSVNDGAQVASLIAGDDVGP